VVAQLEAATGQPLHDLVAGVATQVPRSTDYRDVGTWCSTRQRCERVGHPPRQLRQVGPDRLVADWDSYAAGIAWATDLLEEEHIFDQQRLPSVAVLPVLAAIHQHLLASQIATERRVRQSAPTCGGRFFTGDTSRAWGLAHFKTSRD